MPTITYEIPPDKQADVVAAMRKHYNMPTATPAELNTKIEQEVKQRIRNIYNDFMRNKSYSVDLD